MLDIRRSGKHALLITNSDWSYTRQLMSFAYDRFLPGDMTWRDLFDMVGSLGVWLVADGAEVHYGLMELLIPQHEWYGAGGDVLRWL